MVEQDIDHLEAKELKVEETYVSCSI